VMLCFFCFFFSSRRRHTRSLRDWSSDVCSSDLNAKTARTFWRAAAHLFSVGAISLPEGGDQDDNRYATRPQGKFSYLLRQTRERSEERRVGKESRTRRWPKDWTKKMTEK